jgi:predicted nucleotidyltransferase
MRKSADRPRIQRAIERMVRRIVLDFNPEHIILFGSHARGDAGAAGDVDLLVVMPVEGSKRDKAVEIGVALHDIRVPKDILVVTPEEFERRQDIVGTIERPAAREGKVLYAKAG